MVHVLRQKLHKDEGFLTRQHQFASFMSGAIQQGRRPDVFAASIFIWTLYCHALSYGGSQGSTHYKIDNSLE